MKYSQQVLNMLKRGVNGDVDDYYNFFLELTAKLGEDEAFADGLIAENEPLFDLINDEPMYYFYVEKDDTSSTGKVIEWYDGYDLDGSDEIVIGDHSYPENIIKEIKIISS